MDKNCWIVSISFYELQWINQLIDLSTTYCLRRLIMDTQNVSSEDARNMKKFVIFFCDKKIWLKSVCLTAKYMEGYVNIL